MESDALVDRLRSAGCVFAEEEAALLRAEAPSVTALESWTARRVAGEPLEVIVGWAEVAGVRVGVRRGVFVPRVRTGLLAAQALAHLAGRSAPVAVELCCGAAPIATVIADRVADVGLVAADLDPVAVACARENLPSRARVVCCDLDAGVPAGLRGRVDVLVANAPYVPSELVATMPREARDHEPRSTLDGGPDGLDVLRRVIMVAPAWLAPDGLLLVEAAPDQQAALVAATAAAGLVAEPIADPSLDATGVAARRGLSQSSATVSIPP